MRIVCCECNKEIGYKAPFSDRRATSALCNRCLQQILESRRLMKEWLEKGQQGYEVQEQDEPPNKETSAFEKKKND
jgi:hypothetical protein